MGNRIKCLLVKPNESPQVIETENTLEALQKLVKGCIECVALSSTALLICNEEGKLLGLEANRVIGEDCIAGDFIIVGDDGDGEFSSLSEADIRKYTEQFAIKIADMYIANCFISNLNERFTEMKLNLNELSESYASKDKKLMKEVFRQMHQAFVEAAGTDNLDELADAGEDFITIPAIVQSENTGDLCLALIDIDLSSSGEQWGATFMTKYGIYGYDKNNRETPAQNEIAKFFPHKYYYTFTYEGDIHKAGTPSKEIQEILEFAKANDISLEQDTFGEGMEELK